MVSPWTSWDTGPVLNLKIGPVIEYCKLLSQTMARMLKRKRKAQCPLPPEVACLPPSPALSTSLGDRPLSPRRTDITSWLLFYKTWSLWNSSVDNILRIEPRGWAKRIAPTGEWATGTAQGSPRPCSQPSAWCPQAQIQQPTSAGHTNTLPGPSCGKETQGHITSMQKGALS